MYFFFAVGVAPGAVVRPTCICSLLGMCGYLLLQNPSLKFSPNNCELILISEALVTAKTNFMRFVFTFLFLASLTAYAQVPEEHCKSIKDIATMERLAHQRLSSMSELTDELPMMEPPAFMAGVKIRHVPYKGAGPAMIDVTAGRVPM